MYVLGAGSKKELEGVHPKLVELVNSVIQITAQDFAVHDGLRTEAEQREYVRRGVSKTMNSMHRTQPDGFGHAVDLVPYVNGKLRWEWKPIYVIASAVREVASQMQLELRWGAVWDRNLSELGRSPGELEANVVAYVARRRQLGKSAFIDGPHYELV